MKLIFIDKESINDFQNTFCGNCIHIPVCERYSNMLKNEEAIYRFGQLVNKEIGDLKFEENKLPISCICKFDCNNFTEIPIRRNDAVDLTAMKKNEVANGDFITKRAECLW